MNGWETNDVIRSAANGKVKRVRAVRAGKERGLVLLEGLRLVGEARRCGLALKLLLVAEDRADLAAEFAGADVDLIDGELLDRVSDLKTSPGVLALVGEPDARELSGLGELCSGAGSALVLVVDGVADPANLGALARSAEAAGAVAIVFVAGGASVWNARALRGSMGALLRLPVFAAGDVGAAVDAVRAAGLRVVRPDTRGGVDWRSVDWAPATALWIGGETTAAEVDGLGVTIGMAGEVESLNVTVAASLLLFAAGRVRS